MKRIWHPFWLWEDIGMWRDVSKSDRDAYLSTAFEFTGDARRYGDAMLRVLEEFPIACEHNLSESAMNRQAWIGHAACFLETGCPEYVTREATMKVAGNKRATIPELEYALRNMRGQYK